MLVFLINAVGAVLWCIAYVLIIRQSFRDRTYGMPLLALCCNIVWEFYFSFVYRTSTWGIDFTWFVLDLVILVTYLKFWRTEYPPHLSTKYVWIRMIVMWMTAAGLLIATVSQVGSVMANLHLAFVDNFITSVAFISMLVDRGNQRGQSMAIAWTKLLGTLAASIAAFLQYPKDHLFNVVYIQIFFFDLVYVILLAKPSWWLRPPPDAQDQP